MNQLVKERKERLRGDKRKNSQYKIMKGRNKIDNNYRK